jgi:hypothetical protein
MTAQILSSELSSLISEAKRKQPDIRNVSINHAALLRAISGLDAKLHKAQV